MGQNEPETERRVGGSGTAANRKGLPRFDAGSNSAASRTLPLGTTARVTNTETGRSTTVEIEDRGPYARGRILDVSPRAAQELGMKRDGTARVEIAPVEVPQRDGSTRPGAGAAAASGGDGGRSSTRGAGGGGSGSDERRGR